jgi:hypothetical protein
VEVRRVEVHQLVLRKVEIRQQVLRKYKAQELQLAIQIFLFEIDLQAKQPEFLEENLQEVQKILQIPRAKNQVLKL